MLRHEAAGKVCSFQTPRQVLWVPKTQRSQNEQCPVRYVSWFLEANLPFQGAWRPLLYTTSEGNWRLPCFRLAPWNRRCITTRCVVIHRKSYDLPSFLYSQEPWHQRFQRLERGAELRESWFSRTVKGKWNCQCPLGLSSTF